MAISEDTRRRLYAASGGFCANPDCPSPRLFRDVGEPDVGNIGEVAHVIAQSKAGPRGEQPLTDDERDAFDNLVLLCANCHTIIDDKKLIGRFSVEELLRWKREHQERVEAQVATPELRDREALLEQAGRLLRQNHAIWREYGPESERARSQPGSAGATAWRREAREQILPNNRRILALIDRNVHLLAAGELDVAERFRVHARAFARTQLGNPEAGTPRFPPEMSEIFSP